MSESLVDFDFDDTSGQSPPPRKDAHKRIAVVALSVLAGAAVLIVAAVVLLGTGLHSGHHASTQSDIDALSTTSGTAPTASATPAPTATPVPTASAVPAVAKSACTASQLTVSSVGAGTGGANTADQIFAFQNIGTTACYLNGYPTVRFLDATGTAIQRTALHQQDPGKPSKVSLAAGGSAQFILSTSSLNPDSRCGTNRTAATVQITAPGTSTVLTLSGSFDACRSSVGPVYSPS